MRLVYASWKRLLISSPFLISWHGIRDSPVNLLTNGFVKNYGRLLGPSDQFEAKLHGLRMLAPAIIAHIPLSSADSAMVARNVNRDRKWSGTFAPRTKAARAITLRDRIEDAPCATAWKQFRDEQAPPQMDLELEVVGNY